MFIVDKIKSMMRRPPVLIYQMGKVGSTTLLSTLSRNYSGEVIQAHTYDSIALNHRQSLVLRQYLHMPVYVICPVRDPISRNISAFFQNFTRDTGFNLADRDWSVSELKSMFMKYYPHNVCLEWFDRHMRSAFGIDVYAQMFPVNRKWNIYKIGSTNLLIYRTDIEKCDQLKIISDFLSVNLQEWNYSNISDDKEYNNIYKAFCEKVDLPDIYIDIMCNSSFCRTFWSADEIGRMAIKWKQK